MFDNDDAFTVKESFSYAAKAVVTKEVQFSIIVDSDSRRDRQWEMEERGKGRKLDESYKWTRQTKTFTLMAV